ncbi:MAG: PQQ-binding-like beta-propeller repeat protein, partial [Fimbriiglobus sp.]|nr:PQQ-binding-like beta-propeller repeat protein [Fimbriiglobus sp.]
MLPPLWVTDVLDADPRPAIRHRHELLTLAGGNVVYCSHAGLTVAVNAATGKLAWAFRNPPADRPPVVPFRDLCPAVYADGRVFVAPADGDGVFALDADTGRKLWATVAPVYPEQLLGVARGRLVVTTHATRISAAVVAQGGVRGYDAATGVDKPPLGWQNHDDPILNGYGRGVAADNLVFWPTPAGTMMLDPATGRRARPTNTRLPGNVAVADGFLVVATATELWWYRFDGDVMEPPPPPPPVVGVKDPPPFDPKPRVTVAAPGFTLPAPTVEKKAVELPPLARPLVPLQPERDRPVLLCDGQTLFAHSPDDGKTLWQTKLGVSTPLERVAFTPGRLFAWGRTAVVAAELVAGTIAWEFRPAEGELSAVTFLGNRLVAKLGERGIIALDLNTGKVAWVRSAADENALYPYSIDAAPKFGPHLAAVGERLFVQREGECWALDMATGVRRERFDTTVQEWTSPPAVQDGRPLVPTPQGLAEWTDPVAVEVFDAGREASRTGAPTAARAFDQTLLAVVPRNIGDELHLLGGGRNPTPKLLPPGVALPFADADDDRLFVPADGKLFGLNKATLRESWRLTLPDVGAVAWRVIAGRTTLIVCPTEAVPAERWDAAEEGTKLATRPTALRLIGTTLGAVE